MKGQIIGALMLENGKNSGSFTEDDIELLTTLSNQAMVAIENAWLYESVKTNYSATIQSLVNALEASDRFTKGHPERVRMLCIELCKYIGLDFRELELMEHASILHYIGKIGIDNLILQKQGKLTAKEYSPIKTHPLIGDEILGPIETPEGVSKTIIQHHERYDGSNYPYGLRRRDIPEVQDPFGSRYLRREDDRPAIQEGLVPPFGKRGTHDIRRDAIRPLRGGGLRGHA